MKLIVRLLITIFLIQVVTPSDAQSKKDKKQQAKHLTSYESQTLTDDQLPVLMPYNRWVNPAGDQLYFGDNELENHALDCAVSPDEKWIAVEGRYSVVIISANDKKIVNRTTLKELLPEENAMNTFSGIRWLKKNENYQLFWSASGNAGKSYVIKAVWNGNKLKFEKTYDFIAEKPAVSAPPNEVLLNEENGTTMFY